MLLLILLTANLPLPFPSFIEPARDRLKKMVIEEEEEDENATTFKKKEADNGSDDEAFDTKPGRNNYRNS
jgi:hypothetical protein